MAYIPDSQLDGFNPLKAIGRALGAGGRALVGFIPGVGAAATAVLETAAKMPSPAKIPVPQTPPQPSMNTSTGATSASLVQSGAGDQTSKALLDTVNALLQKAQPQIQPTPQPMIIQQPASQPQYMPPVTQAATPQWLIPAAIGGVGLLAVLMMQKR